FVREVFVPPRGVADQRRQSGGVGGVRGKAPLVISLEHEPQVHGEPSRKHLPELPLKRVRRQAQVPPVTKIFINGSIILRPPCRAVGTDISASSVLDAEDAPKCRGTTAERHCHWRHLFELE